MSVRRRRGAVLWAAAGALLLAGGALLSIPSAALHGREMSGGLHPPAPTVRRGDVLGQQLALFSLGGLRSLAAELLALDATTAWLEQDWPRARERWQQICTLCPQRVHYRIRAARDMAKNAVAHTRERRDLEPRQQAMLEAEYLADAERFLREGTEDNPGSRLLWLELGSYYDDLARRPRFAAAVEAYRRALENGADPMYERWVFYNLCRIRGREAEAYALGRRLWASGRHRTPSVQCLLFVLQHKLVLPERERLSIAELFGTRAKALKALRRFEHNTLRFPVTGIRRFLEQAGEGQPQHAG